MFVPVSGWPQKGVSDELKPSIRKETTCQWIKDVCCEKPELLYQIL